MENIVLIVHLVLALALIGVVLLQRSEGGGGLLGGGGAVTGRAPATPLNKFTWLLGGAFVVTSLTLTILAAADGQGSVLDRLQQAPAVEDGAPGGGLLPPGDGLLPPGLGADDPALPPRAD